MPPLLLLKEAWEHRALILAVALVGLLALAKRQSETIAALRGEPTVEYRDRVVEKRVVVRGPVRVVEDVVKAPDGTVTTRTVTDKAPETTTTDKDREKERTEEPPRLAGPDRTRYFGAGVDPAHPRYVRVRTGLNVLGAVDAGMAADVDTVSRSVGRAMLELTYRF